ncbi:MAG: DUF4330 family protein [Oscillospiraceae bacterium]|nr:DUF4330 family protein [Oscillospiraceae bacterium]
MDNRNFSNPVSRKKTYRFNIIDFILIVIIIAAVSLLIYIMLGNNLFAGSENTTILYTIEIPLIRNDFLGSLHLITKGTTIIDSVRSYNIGEVQEVKRTDAYSNTTNLEDNIVLSKLYPDHSKVTITVKAKCKKDKAKYEVNGKPIMVGTRLDFRTPYLVSYGNCVAIEEINDDGSEKGGTE